MNFVKPVIVAKIMKNKIMENLVSKHTAELIESQKLGESLMSVDVLINIIEAVHGEYSFYQYSVRSQKGCIIALPFFSQKQKFEGYLIYHNKDSYGLSKQELLKLGVETISQNSPSGIAGELTPLPYKTISEDEIEETLDSLIEKNTKVNLADNLSLL